MKHHPVLIITSHPEGMTRAVKHLEVEGYTVKVLDSLSANLIDFFAALSDTDPESMQSIDDTPQSMDVSSKTETDVGQDLDDTSEFDPNMEDDGSLPDSTEEMQDADAPEDTNSNPVYQGMLNDEAIEVHEVPGSDIILHPKSVSGTGDKVKFSLSESIEMVLWEEKDSSEELHAVEVHLAIDELQFDATVKIQVSDMTMDPPVILMGTDWLANEMSKQTEKKK